MNMRLNSYRNKLALLIILACTCKIIIACFTELGNDEAYYWTYAVQPDWSHFDHPPMVGLLMRLTTLNLHWVNNVSARLGAVISCALSSVFIFKTGKIIASEKAGWYAALIYNCSVYAGIIAGLFILPDSPQMFFWTGALYLMSKIIFEKKENQWKLWLPLGLMIGLATLCKIHGVYLWAGFGLFLLLRQPKHLLNYRLYVSIVITLVCLLPIVYWNVQNDFITYQFHSERIAHTIVRWDSFAQEIAGEIVYQNPVIFILLIVSIIFFIKRKIIFTDKQTTLWLLCMSLPMILLFWGLSLFNSILPHWNGPAYIPLYFIAAKYLENKNCKMLPLFVKAAASILAAALISAVCLIRWAPFNFGSQNREDYGEYCPTLDVSGWEQFSKDFAQLVKRDVADSAMQPDAPLIVGKWFPGGHLEFYTSRITGLRVLGIGALQDIHKFAWLNKIRKPLAAGDDAYCIVPSNVPFDVDKEYGKYFSRIEPPEIINQIRGGKTVRYFFIYRLKKCKQVPEIPLPKKLL